MVLWVLWLTVGLTAGLETATQYWFPGGGDSCRQHGLVSSSYDFDGGFCGAPSESLFSQLGEGGACGSVSCSDRGDSCNYCCNFVAGPSCPYTNICHPETGQSAKYLCVKCAESGRCKHTDWIRIGVADACPSVHPCNICKGVNPCAISRRNVDLCQTAFDNIFTSQVADSVNGGGNQISISFNWKQDCPLPGRNVGSGGGSGGSGGSGSGCSDVPPDNQYTCSQQAQWGKCGETWMQGYCLQSCGKCATSCTDIPPSTAYTCAQQAGWGKCGEAWMQGFCLKSCGKCVGPIVEDATAVGVSSTESLSVGAIVGIAVGGAVGLVLLGLLGWKVKTKFMTPPVEGEAYEKN